MTVHLLEAALIFAILADLTILGTSGWRFSIQVVALQGLAVGLAPLLLPGNHLSFTALFADWEWDAWRVVLLSLLAIGLKAVLFPRLLERALRDAHVREEKSPVVGYSFSLLLGVGLLPLAMWLGQRLVPPQAPPTTLFVPAALFTMFSGLFLICARSRALAQVLGYLVLENGVYLFGLAVAPEAPWLLEMGTLLDVFLGVLVMGVALFHISRAFDSIDVDNLSALKDTEQRMTLALLLVPLLAGLASFLPVRQRTPLLRRALLVVAASAHLALIVLVWLDWPQRPEPVLRGWLALDASGLLFLSLTSALFFAASIYAVGYLRREGAPEPRPDFLDGSPFVNEPEAVFIGCLLLFLAAMTTVTLSQHFTLLWVAIEATTLASAPLIYFHRHHRSLEAAWKYLLICSVGIALALPGNFALAAASSQGPEHSSSDALLLLSSLKDGAKQLDSGWLRAAFLFFLVGYGTKMGLAPLHTWLPDAHSESPSLVSALLSGALLNCAFLGILRVHEVCVAAGQASFSGDLLVGFGVLSMATAAVFILGQPDYKRMLAYSSVEHMGILALGAGLGGSGAYGMALHAVNHSFTKGALFLVAGNILAAYRTRASRDVHGLSRVLPVSAALWMAGFLAITGSPPFGTFASEFTILRAALEQDRALLVAGFLALLALIFVGMASAVLPMVQGHAPREDEGPGHATPVGAWPWLTMPSVVLMFLVLALGVYVPPALREVLAEVAQSVGGHGL